MCHILFQVTSLHQLDSHHNTSANVLPLLSYCYHLPQQIVHISPEVSIYELMGLAALLVLAIGGRKSFRENSRPVVNSMMLLQVHCSLCIMITDYGTHTLTCAIKHCVCVQMLGMGNKVFEELFFGGTSVCNRGILI